MPGFNGDYGSVGLVDRLDDPRGLFQLKLFYDSNRQCIELSKLLKSYRAAQTGTMTT